MLMQTHQTSNDLNDCDCAAYSEVALFQFVLIFSLYILNR